MPSFPEKSLQCQEMYLRVRVPGSLKREQAGYVSDFAGNASALEVEMLPRKIMCVSQFLSLTENTTIDSLNGGKMNLTHTLRRFSSSLLCCVFGPLMGRTRWWKGMLGKSFFLVLAQSGGRGKRPGTRYIFLKHAQ